LILLTYIPQIYLTHLLLSGRTGYLLLLHPYL
jgi:hypothetical protein